MGGVTEGNVDLVNSKAFDVVVGFIFLFIFTGVMAS
jgi:hypothetical protein